MPISEENLLEKSLQLAATEPAYRPDFYKALLNSTIYVIGKSNVQISGKRTAEEGESISILNWSREDGSPIIPFFTSLSALQTALDQETNYVALPAQAFFEMTKGSFLVLNAKSPYGKEFTPNEIESLLTNGVNHASNQRIVKEATQVLLGQPAIYPAKMIDSLKKFLCQRSNVNAAYLALMHDSSLDEKPHLLVGIDASGDIEKIIREAGSIVGDTSPNGEFVDLIRIKSEDQGLSEYFLREVRPFYKKTWGNKLKYALGIGSRN
jgi:hypothetical protein